MLGLIFKPASPVYINTYILPGFGNAPKRSHVFTMKPAAIEKIRDKLFSVS